MAVYVLALVIMALFVFVYFQTRLFTGVIACLVDSLTELKSYTLGHMAEKTASTPTFSAEPSHPDFGLGAVMEEVNKAEGEDKSEFDGRG